MYVDLRTARCRRPVLPRLVFGICVIAVGVVLLLDRLDVVDSSLVLSWWPVALIGLGIAKMLVPYRRFGGLILAIVGAALLLHKHPDLLPVRPGDLWPVIVILFGMAMVYRAIVRHRALEGAAGSDPLLASFAFLGGAERRISSPDFKGGHITAILGGCEIDLRQARIGGSEAVIDVFAMWGGIKLTVPEDWAVVSEVVPILGGVEDKTRVAVTEGTAERKRLMIKGSVIMGGLEIKN